MQRRRNLHTEGTSTFGGVPLIFGMFKGSRCGSEATRGGKQRRVHGENRAQYASNITRLMSMHTSTLTYVHKAILLPTSTTGKPMTLGHDLVHASRLRSHQQHTDHHNERRKSCTVCSPRGRQLLTDLQAAAGVRLEVSLQVFEIEAAGGVLADLTEDDGGVPAKGRGKPTPRMDQRHVLRRYSKPRWSIERDLSTRVLGSRDCGLTRPPAVGATPVGIVPGASIRAIQRDRRLPTYRMTWVIQPCLAIHRR